MNEFEITKDSTTIQISYIAKNNIKKQKINKIIMLFHIVVFLIATVYNCYLRYVNGIFAFALLTLGFFGIYILSLKSNKRINAYHLTIDSNGFHESSVSFQRKDILWEEVCYIDCLPDIYTVGGKYARKYPILVISKTEMDREERIKFWKRQAWGSSIDKSSLPNAIVIVSNIVQIDRIYQLITEQAVLHGCEHALQKEVEDD